MSDTYQKLVEIVSKRCEIDEDEILPDVNLIDDLGIDSIDFLDITYDIDRHYKIELPVASWMELINEGEASLDDYFIVNNLVQKIDELSNQEAMATA